MNSRVKIYFVLRNGIVPVGKVIAGTKMNMVNASLRLSIGVVADMVLKECIVCVPIRHALYTLVLIKKRIWKVILAMIFYKTDAIFTDKKLFGLNLLGKALMEIRDRIA